MYPFSKAGDSSTSCSYFCHSVCHCIPSSVVLYRSGHIFLDRQRCLLLPLTTQSETWKVFKALLLKHFKSIPLEFRRLRGKKGLWCFDVRDKFFLIHYITVSSVFISALVYLGFIVHFFRSHYKKRRFGTVPIREILVKLLREQQLTSVYTSPIFCIMIIV